MRKFLQQTRRLAAIDDEQFAQADMRGEKQFLRLRPAPHLIKKTRQPVQTPETVGHRVIRAQERAQVVRQAETIDDGQIAYGVGHRDWMKS